MNAQTLCCVPLEQRSPLARALPIAAVIAFGISVLPLLSWYARRVSDGSDEPLGVIALVVALFMLATSTRYGKRDRIGIFPGRLLVSAALLSFIQFGGVLHYPLLIGLLAIAAIAFSVKMPRGKAGTIALLVLSLPLVASLDFYAGYPLRLIAAEITTFLLKLGGIPVEKSGVMLIDGDRLVGIDPPCAGIRMLWTSSFVAAVLAARMRLSWLRTLALLAVALACVIVGNGVRAAIVFFPESGRVEWPDWAHPGAGLLVHGAVLLAVFGFAGRLNEAGNRWSLKPWWQGPRNIAKVSVGILLVGAGLFLTSLVRHRPAPGSAATWPTMLDGVSLLPQPLSPMEQSFARSFPGEIAKFRWGDAEVIMRRSHQATRMMHPSSDCLRAAGYETHSEAVFRDADGQLWGASLALRDGKRWLVHERYVSENGDACTDASAWYWQAMLHPDAGPWTATTVIRPSTRSSDFSR
ncbi:exosortase/archaeosortase family protein [Haloferula chungangensis]|uniref:Exosortase/archaeosortase family protein n=1 Tax=Haloferula chungangensis TaxID=1048331 RepID=A0ABW2LA48_9BACT